MSFTKSISSVLVFSLLNLTISTALPHFAGADVTGSLTGEKFFIKISRTLEGEHPDDTRIEFEECQVENPTECNPIGSRDYSIGELRAQHELLTKEAEKEGSAGVSSVLGAILGSVGGAGTGVYAGAATGAAVTAPGFVGLGAAVAGAFIGAAVVAVAGGIVVYKIIRHHKKKKAKKLDAEADTVEDQIIEDQPVSIATDVDTFAKALASVLSSLPAQAPKAN